MPDLVPDYHGLRTSLEEEHNWEAVARRIVEEASS
jgi:hypothetical protein